MRRLVASVVGTEAGLVVSVLAGLLVAYIGLAVLVSGEHPLEGAVVLLVGLWSLLRTPVVHDQCHRDRGEPVHAVWGRDGRRKPSWWPPRWS